VLEAVYHAEGRVYNNGGALRYEYAIRDHLGNTRLTFTDKNGNGVVDVTNTSANEILQENHFYPFGLDLAGPWMNDAAQDNFYKYNGKELNGDFGLNWMDYGARWYDGSLGRWWSVDLMLGKYMEWSPYNYAKDNPVIFIDPNGMFTSWNPGMQEMIDGSKKVQERGIGNMQNGNTIYVLGLNGADKSVIKGLKSILEKFINAANLTTNVVMVGDSKKFDITKIKTTDAVAVVGGNKKEAANFILQNLDKGYLSKEFKEGLRGGDFIDLPSYIYPELSDEGNSKWGYVIATSTMDEEKYSVYSGSVKEKFSFLTMTDAVALFILHGMGHNSGISHFKGRIVQGNPDSGFMADGEILANLISRFNGDITSLIKYTVQTYPSTIEIMQNRFKPIND
jgi:RHS repeat-associated protein